MSFEQSVSIIELLLTFIGLILIVFGWIIPYYQNIKIEKQKNSENLNLQKMKWEKDFVEEQISQFYGPISMLLREKRLLFERILEMFGRRKVFLENQTRISDLTDDEQKIWIHYVNTYKIPIDKRIIEIIRNKHHLIYNSEMPECFHRYLDYALGWELLDNQKRNDVPNYYEYYYCFNFPKDFRIYIDNTLSLLQNKKEELIRKTKNA